MDPISHLFWTTLGYKIVNNKTAKKLNIWLAGFFSVLPDLLSFLIPTLWIIWVLVSGQVGLTDLPRPDNVQASDSLFVFNITNILYAISHSLIIFLFIFGAVSLICRRVIWEMFAWLIHILIDIPLHDLSFYATPFLWPLTNWKFDGYDWEEPAFMIPNIIAIAITVTWLVIRKKKNAQ